MTDTIRSNVGGGSDGVFGEGSVIVRGQFLGLVRTDWN